MPSPDNVSLVNIMSDFAFSDLHEDGHTGVGDANDYYGDYDEQMPYTNIFNIYNGRRSGTVPSSRKAAKMQNPRVQMKSASTKKDLQESPRYLV